MDFLTAEQLIGSADALFPAYATELEALFAPRSSEEQMLSLPEFLSSQSQKHGLLLQELSTSEPLFCAEIAGTSAITLLLYYHFDASADSPTQLLPWLASLGIIDLYQHLNCPFPLTVRWLLDGRGADAILDLDSLPSALSTLLQADYALWVQQTPLPLDAPVIALGTKGYLRVALAANTAFPLYPSSYGGVLPNAAWSLLWALNSLKDAHEDILIEGFYDDLLPADDTAIDTLATLPGLLPDLPLTEQVPPFLLHLHGLQLHYAHVLIPTCSVISFNSQPEHASGPPDKWNASIPAQAQAQVDFHLVPAQDPSDIFAKLERHLSSLGFTDLSLTKRSALPTCLLPTTAPFVWALKQVTQKVYGNDATLIPLSVNPFPFAHLQQALPLLVQYVHLATDRGQTFAIEKEQLLASMKQLLLLLTQVAGR